MNAQARPMDPTEPTSTDPANGSGAAAILAAGIGCFLVGAFAVLGDKSAFFHAFFNFVKATGPLSGVTTLAIVIWLVVWAALRMRWRNRSVPLARINAVSIALLILSLLLTFPPIGDLF